MSFPDRGSRPRNAFNELVAATAVLGIGASGWGVWLEVEEYRDRQASRERITEACGGLVDPDRVLGLHGGTARVRPGQGSEDTFTLDSLPGGCAIYRVEDPGTAYGHFALSVYTNPGDDHPNVVDDSLNPFFAQHRGGAEDVTRVADQSPDHPLDYPAEDDGRLGHYNDDSATFKVTCKTAKTARDDVTSVNVVTKALYDDVSLRDLRTVIELAAGAAYKVADHLGCTPEDQHAASFPRLWIPDAKLKKATEAKGSCRWYAEFLGQEGLGSLPDRARETPREGEHSFKRSCLLAASPAQVKRVWPELPERYGRLEGVLGHSPWWLRTESYFGDEARKVVGEAFGGKRTPLTPGTSGRAERADIWWASSTCDGEPAVHTLTVSYSYVTAIEPRLRPLFKAYVDHITAAHDCTDITFPTTSALPSE
ncbi:hypothetical protein [Streptomyces tailanensis]|uniref:hypothetical protein n=1 Tax=Streptomyces tailanensis TaxID=2569858 RepID=UPI00122DCAF1|nr:hypothetical protein [Streptomyces tailanensis]